MITNQDRSKWIGASDTAMVMGNWKTLSFEEWFFEKIELGRKDKFNSWAMQCGNILEHQIIDCIDAFEEKRTKKGKHPYYIRKWRLRVNYDGLRRDEVIEVKTTSKEWKTVPKAYWQQCQVLMFVKKKKKARIIQYMMTEDDYANPYFADVRTDKIREHLIEFDKKWIKNCYLPRLKYLAYCIKKRIFPAEWEFRSFYENTYAVQQRNV